MIFSTILLGLQLGPAKKATYREFMGPGPNEECGAIYTTDIAGFSM